MARWLEGTGVEIGALHNPLHLPSGTTVRYVDRVPTERLRAQYPDLGELVPISLIGNAHDLSALADEEVDFVIANHLVEHLEDPIRGIAEMLRVIRTAGILYLAIPDPRATFDKGREVTPIDHIIAEYHQGTAQTRGVHFREWVDLVELPGQDLDTFDRDARVQQLLDMDYSIHFHVYRPDTFVDLLCAARREAGIQFELIDFAPCDPDTDDEFIFVLGKGVAIHRPTDWNRLSSFASRRRFGRRLARRLLRTLRG
jgi:SAM-dependent methyltransferase